MPPILDRPSEWDEHHSTFRELYWIEKKELPEVMRIMKAEHGFIATYVFLLGHFLFIFRR